MPTDNCSTKMLPWVLGGLHMTHESITIDDRNFQEQYQEDPMEIYSVRLTAWHARHARRLGMGNLGRGIRIAIERASKDSD